MNTHLSDDDLEGLAKDYAATTPGDWLAAAYDNNGTAWWVSPLWQLDPDQKAVVGVNSIKIDDAKFIIRAHYYVPLLLAEVTRLRAREVTLTREIDALEEERSDWRHL